MPAPHRPPPVAPLGRAHLVTAVRAALRAPVPALLISAPPSTGSRTTVRSVAHHLGYSPWDVREFPDLGPDTRTGHAEPALDRADVEALAAWARLPPAGPAGRLALVRLDHVRRHDARDPATAWTASQSAQHALLKLLEEPPSGRDGPRTRFALLGTGRVGPGGVTATVASRATACHAGLLGVEALGEVVARVGRIGAEDARAAAGLGGGRVSPALAVLALAPTARTAVAGLLRDLDAADFDAVSARSPGWRQIDTDMLVLACHETLTGRYRVFDGLAPAVTRRGALSVLRWLRTVPGAAPRTVPGGLCELVQG